MAALQLMIQNLLYDLSQLSLPWDNMDQEFVRRPRKWDAPGKLWYLRRFRTWL
jgi:Mg2+-importing ATPase